MGEDTWSFMLTRMREYCVVRPGHSMSLVLHGGEPTLIGLERFETMILQAQAELSGYLRYCSMQTNGTRLDRQWCQTISKLGVSIGVSLDGPPDIHDRARVDHAGRGSYDATRRGIEHLREAGVEPHILCVVQPGADGLAVYRHFRELGIRWMNFLIPDVSHDSRSARYSATTMTPVADFLLPAFDAWWREDDPGVRVSIFWELISALLGGATSSDCFGNRPLGYVVVESDGEIGTMDALRVCKHGLGSTPLNVHLNRFEDLKIGSPWVYEVISHGLPVPTKCGPCRYASVCGGGSLPHRYSEDQGFDNPSVWCLDIQIILDRMSSAINDARAN